ncbi:hypothetical protein HN011_010964 [Eciton burchellii]|nr:hypothetical protein HN011_010964 [Eciton burchellii]
MNSHAQTRNFGRQSRRNGESADVADIQTARRARISSAAIFFALPTVFLSSQPSFSNQRFLALPRSLLSNFESGLSRLIWMNLTGILGDCLLIVIEKVIVKVLVVLFLCCFVNRAYQDALMKRKMIKDDLRSI